MGEECKKHEKSVTVITRSQGGWGETKLKLNDPIPKWYYTLRTKLYHSYTHTYISHKGTGCESIYNSYGQVSTLQYFLWYASFPVISHVMYKNVDFNGWGDVGSYQPFGIILEENWLKILNKLEKQIFLSKCFKAKVLG